LTLLPRDAAGDRGSLGDVTGDSAELALTNSWQVDPGLEVSARGRTTWTRGFNDGVRGTAAVGGRWAANEALTLRADAGIALGGESAGAGAGAVALEGGGREWSWSVSRGHEIGRGAFATDPAPGGPPDLLLVDADAATDYWLIGVGWQGPDGAPQIHLRTGRISVDGGLAPRLPGDAPVVPLQMAGAAAGRRWELGFSAPASGTAVLVTWEALNDASGAGRLIEGAGQWERRAVSLRQRLSRFGAKGLNWELIMGAEENWLTPRQATTDDPVRTALLGRRRVSGGMSITF
jgi:hypothetical protein